MADSSDFIQDDEAEIFEELNDDHNAMAVDDADDDDGAEGDDADWETEGGSVADAAERLEADDGDNAVFEDDSVQGFFSHREPVYAVATSPVNPDLVATGGGDDKTRLWRLTDGEEVACLSGHADSVSAVAFSADGSLLASGGLDGKILVAKTSDGSLVATLEGPDEVQWLDWHPKGLVLLAGSKDGSAWMWNLPSGRCMNVFSGHTSVNTAGRFTPDGKSIVTVSEDSSLRLWDPKTGACVWSISGQTDGRFHNDPIHTLAVSPDSMLALTGSEDGGIRLVHLQNGKLLHDFQGHAESVESLSFGPTTPQFASGSLDGTVRVWDLTTRGCRWNSGQHPGGSCRVAWAQPHLLISAGVEDRSVAWRDPRSGDGVKVVKGHTMAILDMAVSCDAKRVITASDDQCALVFALD